MTRSTAALAVVLVGVALCVCAQDIPQRPFSPYAVPSLKRWETDLGNMGAILGSAGAQVNNTAFVAVFLSNGFALMHGADGRVIMSEMHPASTVFMDFVHDHLIFVTHRKATCIDPQSGKTVTSWSLPEAEGEIRRAAPTGGNCEAILAVVHTNGTSSLWAFHHSDTADRFFTLPSQVMGDMLVMDEGGETVVVFGLGDDRHFMGVTYLRGAKFHMELTSGVVIGPMLYNNHFFIGDKRGVVLRCNVTGGVVTEYKPAAFGDAVRSIDIAHDGRTLISSVGEFKICSFDVATGVRSWEVLAPPAAHAQITRVSSSVYNSWEDYPELFENDTLWYHDEAGYLFQINTVHGEWVAVVNVYPRPEVHKPTFASMVEGDFIVFQPYDSDFICAIDIVTAHPQFCYQQPHPVSAHPIITDVASWNKWEYPVFTNDLGKVFQLRAYPLPTFTFDPEKAYQGYEYWTAKTGNQFHALASNGKIAATLADDSIKLYDMSNGKQVGKTIAAPTVQAIYFGIVEGDLVAISAGWVRVIAMEPPYEQLSMYEGSDLHYAVPTGLKGEMLIFQRTHDGNSTILTYTNGTVTHFTTSKSPVTVPPIYLKMREDITEVHGEGRFIVGTSVPSGKELFRNDMGSMNYRGPWRVGAFFYVGLSTGHLMEYKQEGTLLTVYNTDVNSQILSVDVSLDGHIIAVHVGKETIVGFDIGSKVKLYHTKLYPRYYLEYDQLYRVWASTVDDWASHIDPWHNDIMWYYDEYSCFYPFNIHSGCFEATLWVDRIDNNMPKAAFASGSERIVMQMSHGAGASFMCSLYMNDTNMVDICTKEPTETLMATEWNAVRSDIIVAMTDGRVADIDQVIPTSAPSGTTQHPTTEPPVTTAQPTTTVPPQTTTPSGPTPTGTPTTHPTSPVTSHNPSSTPVATTTSAPSPSGTGTAWIVIICFVVVAAIVLAVIFRRTILGWYRSLVGGSELRKEVDEAEGTLNAGEGEELKSKKPFYQAI